jgi:hypothetical protein
MAQRRCYVCRRTLDLTEFYADATRGDGRGSRCKACDDARDRVEHDRRKYQRRKGAALSAGDRVG